MQNLTLYTYCRSSASYRVRIALNLKGLTYHPEYIHLIKDGGQEKSERYLNINPQKLVPSLSSGNQILTQSLAIIEFIEEEHPQPSLLPSAPVDRAFVRSLAYTVGCEIQPLNNLRVLQYLENQFQIEKSQRDLWYSHWVQEGFTAIETRLNVENHDQGFCFGDQPSFADLCLIPQVYNAIRFNCDMAQYPLINHIYQNCTKIAAFQQAAPEQQADF